MPVMVRATGTARMAASVEGMTRHCQMLAEEAEVRQRWKAYQAQRQRRRTRQSNRGLQEQVSRAEASLELQAMILYELAQAEQARKTVPSDTRIPAPDTGKTERLLYELLVTTFPCGI